MAIQCLSAVFVNTYIKQKLALWTYIADTNTSSILFSFLNCSFYCQERERKYNTLLAVTTKLYYRFTRIASLNQWQTGHVMNALEVLLICENLLLLFIYYNYDYNCFRR